MISNNLAINQFFLKKKSASDDDRELDNDFPTWVTPGDQKLLHTGSLRTKANLVVSQARGSKFRTIQLALKYAACYNHRNKRYIIYIKRGVYKENIEIGNDLNNIMFLGDGARYTIIPGSRSVGGGFTTYSSATVVYLIIIRMLVLEVALQKAQEAQSCSNDLSNKSKSKRKMVVWLDCNKIWVQFAMVRAGGG
ncbi:unnamed protein product [Lactuca saligna]|uniref:Pectinesterase catalytic domain-containing protein n=1 Tax=Lactuca saligna TaxID=75948 RepID=A0AA35ZJ19_LACSI|nr:unnamed protein product [Lactuca saligna]